MKSDQGTTIVMIIFILLSVLLMVLCWVFYSASKDNFQKFEDASKKASDAESAARTATGNEGKLKEILGVAVTVDIADIEKKYEDQAKGIPDTAKGYTDLVNLLYAKLNGVTKELAGANAAKVDLENKFAALYEDTQNQIRIHEAAAQAAQKKLQEEQGLYAKSMAEREATKQYLENEYQRIQRDAEASIVESKTETAVANDKIKTIRSANENLTKELNEVRSPVLVQEDGKVLSVNQLSGVVTLNIGSAVGLRNGITFAVFDPAEKNLAEARSKGSIEISQVLGPNRAEARMLDTVITDPIQRGDLIYTPVWKPGLYPRFVLSGRMVVPNFGSRGEDNTTVEDDLKDVINLIIANGGIVDYYMKNNGTIMKVNTRVDALGKLQVLGEEEANFAPGGDEILQETAFLVVGKGDAMNNALMANMKVLDEQAKIHGIRTITLPELLRQMGWRNAVPSQGYGRRANESDIAPRPTKPMPVSSGTVAPIYSQQAEVTKRTSPGTVAPIYRDDTVMKSSPGTTSPLYQKDRKPVNASSGTVSGIYGGK